MSFAEAPFGARLKRVRLQKHEAMQRRSPLQMTAIVAVGYLVALGFIYVLDGRSLLLLLGLFGLPVLVGARLFGFAGGFVCSLLSSALLIPFVPLNAIFWLPLAGALYITAGALVGALSRDKSTARRRFHDPPGAFLPRGPRLEWLPEAFRHSSNIVQLIDPNGNIFEQNEKSEELLGAPKKIIELFHPDDRGRFQEELESARTRGEAGPIELRVISHNNRAVPVEVRLHRITPDRLLMELSDLTAIWELEMKLRETEARYRYLIEDAIDTLDTGIMLLDKERRVIWANKTLGQFFGIERDEMVGHPVKSVLKRLRFTQPTDFDRIVSSAGDRLTFSLRDGFDERILEFRSIPVETANYKGGRIDHYIDITEKKRLELSLHEKTKRLEYSNKKLEEFARVVSHDLKEPLRTIEVFSQFLLEDWGSKIEGKGVEYLQALRRSAARMKRLIEDLHRLSSIGLKAEPMEEINISEVLAEVREDMSASLTNVSVITKDGFPTIMGNRTRLKEIFSNLISNAIKYNDKPQKIVEIDWEEDSDHYKFFVRDNGVGIEERYWERVFEVFERLNPRHDQEGTGAGLAIVKRIVEEYGGRIWVTSVMGSGSTFCFTIPKRAKRIIASPKVESLKASG